MDDTRDVLKPSPRRGANAKASGFAAFFLGLVGLVHLCRAAAGWEIVIEGWAVPVWWSGAVGVPLLALATIVWREAHR